MCTCILTVLQKKKKFFREGEIRISWLICVIRVRAVPTKSYRFVNYEQEDNMPQLRPGFLQRSKLLTRSCIPCRDIGVDNKSVTHAARDGIQS